MRSAPRSLPLELVRAAATYRPSDLRELSNDRFLLPADSVLSATLSLAMVGKLL
jgi:hypothetical protein